MKSLKACSAISFLGTGVFVLIVFSLQSVQVGYSPTHQLMSELALGDHGERMLAAFCALAAALLALAVGVGIKHQWLLCSALSIAAVCFFGAGIFPLGATSEIHIALMATAFVAIGVSMYVLPSYAQVNERRRFRQYSWSLLFAFSSCIAAGSTVVPLGIGQRGAALAMLFWIAASAWKLPSREASTL